jgi:hypothetical protein
MSKVTQKSDGTPRITGIQVYDKSEEKVVDIPEDEVEEVQNSRRVYFAIKRNFFKAKDDKISARNFITGLLRFAIAEVESGLKQKPELDEQWKRISESVDDKIIQAFEDANDSEDDRAAIAKFKKPCKQLSDAEKETLEEDLDDRFTMDAVAFTLICRALDLWTPKFWRLNAVAAKIEEAFQDEAEKQKADPSRIVPLDLEAEKEKAKAEKRVPVGN